VKCEIISVGTELVVGETVDTNAAFLSGELAALGLDVRRHSCVRDDAGELSAAVAEAASRAGLVILTGGIGPTPDDVTREAVARAAGAPLERNEEALEHIRRLFAERGRKMSENNARQGDFPRGARVIPNPRGTAAGFRVACSGAAVVVLPGVPSEMREMWAESVRPYLAARSGGASVSVTINCFGRGESGIAAALDELMEPGRVPEVGTTAEEGVIKVHVRAAAAGSGEGAGAAARGGGGTAAAGNAAAPAGSGAAGEPGRGGGRAEAGEPSGGGKAAEPAGSGIAGQSGGGSGDAEAARGGGGTAAESAALVEETAREVERRLGECVFGRDSETLESVVVARLVEEGLTLAVAESCTGGLISKRITDVPGASECFVEGVVAYHNDAKVALCGVNPALIKEHGAVSSQVARAMAEGVRERAGTDFALSATGIAGPGGGAPEKPVGLVFVALSGPAGTEVRELRLHGDRRRVRDRTAKVLLNELRLALGRGHSAGA